MRDYLAGCSWEPGAGRVETAHRQPVLAWLNQVSSRGLGVIVEWDAGTANDLGIAVAAAIPRETLEIIQAGLHDSETGLVLHDGRSLAFVFESVNGVPTMVPCE
ncbi:MAG: hypothetical protein M3Y87_03175 [Myxococcota bacterium]|nr:hypothetical protein [Myxococcota bacterium]